MASSRLSQSLGGFVDGGADANISRATAEVPSHGFVDVGIRRIVILFKQCHGAHDLARLAITTLYDVEALPSILDGLGYGHLVHAFNGSDLLTGSY